MATLTCPLVEIPQTLLDEIRLRLYERAVECAAIFQARPAEYAEFQKLGQDALSTLQQMSAFDPAARGDVLDAVKDSDGVLVDPLEALKG